MTTVSTAPTVRLERLISAPPERVYRAWVEPDLLREWLVPGAMGMAGVEVDARVGGRYRIWHRDPNGVDVGGFECELVALEPGRELVFRWGFVGPDRETGPIYDSLLTVSLEPAGDGATRLILVHEQLDGLAAALPDVAALVETGWQSALDKLTGLVAEIH
jgi:uncharacterized protein YndB with AHSA1/START domain